MFGRKNKKESKEIDISSLNSILSTGKKIVNIGYLMAIVALVLLATYIMKEWKIFSFIKDLTSLYAFLYF